MILKRSEDNESELIANVRPSAAFDLIPEDDEEEGGSVIVDDLSDVIEEQPAPIKQVNVAARPEEVKKGPQTSIPPPVSGADLIAQLGEFITTPESLLIPAREVYCINDWESLYHRYKPEHIRKEITHLGLISTFL